MKIIYSRRALADLEQIADYYSSNASPSIADAIQQRFLRVIDASGGRRKSLPA